MIRCQLGFAGIDYKQVEASPPFFGNYYFELYELLIYYVLILTDAGRINN
jgi:hypothetical protein